MKKTDLANAKVAVLTYSAAVAMMAVLPGQANATTCTAGSSTSGVVCAFTTGDFTVLAQSVNFTGSNEVNLNVSGDTTGFAACGSHTRGTSSYGGTLSGGSMTVTTGTVAAPKTGLSPAAVSGGACK